jgi:hypothetical protein
LSPRRIFAYPMGIPLDGSSFISPINHRPLPGQPERAGGDSPAPASDGPLPDSAPTPFWRGRCGAKPQRWRYLPIRRSCRSTPKWSRIRAHRFSPCSKLYRPMVGYLRAC